MTMGNSITNLNGISALTSAGSSLLRFIPEPRNRAGAVFRGLLDGVSGTLSGLGADVGALPGDLIGLLDKQIEVQMQMQTVSLVSNIEKSKHETEMAAIRNMRVG